MITICESCGADILTEADPHVVRPTPQGYKFYCSCGIKDSPKVVTPIAMYDHPIEQFLSGDIYKSNMAVQQMTTYYSSDLLKYVLAKHGIDIAFKVASAMVHHYEYELDRG